MRGLYRFFRLIVIYFISIPGRRCFSNNQRIITCMVGNLIHTFINVFVFHPAVFHHDYIPAAVCKNFFHLFHFLSGFHQNIVAGQIQAAVRLVGGRNNM